MLKSRKTNKVISTTRRVIILPDINYAKDFSVSISKAICSAKLLVSNANIDFLKLFRRKKHANNSYNDYTHFGVFYNDIRTKN